MADRFGLLSKDVWALRIELGRILEGEVAPLGPAIARCDAFVDWSDRRGAAARRLARLTGRPFYGLTVGPLGGVRPFRDPPMSLRLTRAVGLASRPPGASDVEADLALLRRLRLAWRNDGRDRAPPLTKRRVLVVAGRGQDTTARIGTARRDEPGSAIVVVADAREPDRVALELAKADAEVQAVVATNPWALFHPGARVYGGATELGSLARLAGCEVDRTLTRDVAALFRSHFHDGALYLDAWSRTPVPFAEAAEQLAWLRDRFLENDRRSYAVGVSRWKAAQTGRFLDGPDGPAVFGKAPEVAIAKAARKGGQVVAWHTRMPERLAADCAAAKAPLVRMEDGFLRSVGLGAAFLPGASAVLDERGIYYDPTGPSDLEHILETGVFPPELVARAAALRERVVALRLTKYNVGRATSLGDLPEGREIVLVPGQVEDDASVQLGTRTTRTNLALLQAARARRPDAFLIFKPHPDVAAGLRRGAVPAAVAHRHADRVVDDVAIAELLDRVDRVETMTSLAGFEALLRGVKVTAHGRPFYAGWGLTEDLDPPDRRSRRLTLDELVAGALILYPRYVDPVTGLRCTPEILAQRLAEAREASLAASPIRAATRMAYVRARHAILGPIGTALRRARDARQARAVDPGRE